MHDTRHIIARPTKRNFRSFLQEKAVEEQKEKRTYINGAKAVLDMQRSSIYRVGSRVTPDEEHEQTLRCIHLWRAVILQAFVDATSCKYKKSEDSATRHEAMRWLEGINKKGKADHEGMEDRAEVLEYAEVSIYELKRGIRNIKLNNYDIRDTVYYGKTGQMRDRIDMMLALYHLENEADGEELDEE